MAVVVVVIAVAYHYFDIVQIAKDSIRISDLFQKQQLFMKQLGITVTLQVLIPNRF